MMKMSYICEISTFLFLWQTTQVNFIQCRMRDLIWTSSLIRSLTLIVKTIKQSSDLFKKWINSLSFLLIPTLILVLKALLVVLLNPSVKIENTFLNQPTISMEKQGAIRGYKQIQMEENLQQNEHLMIILTLWKLEMKV